jgi:hypothetical protein
MSTQAWRTDEDLYAARQRFAAEIPGYAQPVAYGVARLDGATLTFAHVNRPGDDHLLPAVVLAAVCGHAAATATYRLTTAQLATAVELLAPAEAATHWDHPNLWSWRDLLRTSPPDSEYVACFVRDVDDPIVNEWDAAFRALLAS